VAKEYRSWTPEQSYLLPPSPTQWLPEGHLAYFVIDLIRELDLCAIEDVIQSRDGRGTRPYSPRMMTALLFYGYCVGVFSSRKMERATYEDVAFRVIAAGEHPDHTRINEFRLAHRNALANQFEQVLELCKKAGLGSVGHVSIDGTKVQASASKHKAMSYGRMRNENKRLSAEIEQLLFRADEEDAREDALYGKDKRGDEVPEELRRRETRVKKIREAKAALEKEAAQARAAQLRELAKGERHRAETAVSERDRKQAAARAASEEKQADELCPRDDDDDDEPPPSATELPRHQVHTTPKGEPTDKAQRNFTDPDSRIMVKNGIFLQAYNGHAAVNESQIIVAHGVSNQPPDHDYLVPMLERVKKTCGAAPQRATADSGYFSEANFAYCDAEHIDAYIATGRKLDSADIGKLPMTPAADAKWRMHEKLSTPEGRAIYARRKVLPEPVFGQIKSAMGFRRFSLRGLSKVMTEWALVCTCHDVLKLFRAKWTLRPAPA
jgi:transposase